MPLSKPAPRVLFHMRHIECYGYHREDGLWDIEGHVIDRKTYHFPSEDRGDAVQPGEALHNMWIRLTIDEQFTVHDAEACTDDSPFKVCPGISERYKKLKGLRIGPGWNLQLRELFGGINGCKHLTELLGPIATVAFQTIYGKQHDVEDAKPPLQRQAPPMLNACHALASTSPVVQRQWPKFYTGGESNSIHDQKITDDCIYFRAA